ncbi:hypothetical protein WJX81_000481 [Elliptochloris bilobata]|uniref:Peptidase M20 dimerisation domain-containing protein n=1 Tax=Elliptochloris bilobata TaxID=381761 RepID=A0AAW1QMM7_9CHLO
MFAGRNGSCASMHAEGQAGWGGIEAWLLRCRNCADQWLDNRRQAPLQWPFRLTCAALAYERPGGTEAAVRGWGFHWEGSSAAVERRGGTHQPSWFAFSNAHAVVLVFGGGSTLGLLSWRGAGAAADAWLASARHGRGQDVGGVCIGVLRALFALPPGGQHCLYDGARPLVAAAALRRKRLYLAGHGIGGALAAAFAALLHTWQDAPQVLAQVSGIYTFGAPAVGDAAFAALFDGTFAGRAHRLVAARDIVPRLPLLPAATAAAPASRFGGQYELLQFAAIPSVSGNEQRSSDMGRAAEWLAHRLTAAGLQNVQALRADVPPDELKKKQLPSPQPAVYAEWLGAASGAPTILVYGHYDVQDSHEWYHRRWASSPWEPHVADGFVHGRGVDDNKGGLLLAVQALEAFLKTGGEAPVNVKVLFEGEEELGSPHLHTLLQQNARLLAADLAVSADAGQPPGGRPGINLGCRGRAFVRVVARTLTEHAHSGFKGGAVQNAVQALAQWVATLHHVGGGVAVAGFYDGVVDPSAAERADAAAFPVDEAAEMAGMGANASHGEPGFTATERIWYRPSLDVVGFAGGVTWDGMNGIVPADANCKIICRLVPGQDQDTVLAALERHARLHAPAATALELRPVTVLGRKAVAAVSLDRYSPGVRAAAQALSAEFGGADPIFYREGHYLSAFGEVPRVLGAPLVEFGFGTPDHVAQSSPGGGFRINERLSVAEYHRGRRAWKPSGMGRKTQGISSWN